jgi:steroid delta-isomerase-like uncharacterized protein
MSTERNKQVVRRLYDVVNSGDIETLNELAVLDYDEHDPLPGQATGRQGLADRVTILRTAFAPQFTIEDVIAEHDKVVVRWTNETTHIGEFLGVPATGEHVTIAGIDIYRLRDGQLAEHWHVVDQVPWLARVGLLSTPAATRP